MRISHGLRAAVAVACLLATAGCSHTVDGAASCSGCVQGSEPDFPTGRPTRTMPTPVPVPAPGAQTLTPDESGLVFVETKSGKTRCQISSDTVGCESDFTNAPTVDGAQANGAEVSSDGGNRWIVGNLGAIPTTTMDYATYRALGWTIEADSAGTRFTNDATGHGMFISIEGVNFF
jgi:hypothetical protein